MCVWSPAYARQLDLSSGTTYEQGLHLWLRQTSLVGGLLGLLLLQLCPQVTEAGGWSGHGVGWPGAWPCAVGLGGGATGSELTDILLLLSEAEWKPQVIVLPIPVPIFVPVPMHMYCQKVPVPFSMPVPVSNTLHLLMFSHWLNPALLQPPCFSVHPLLLPLLWC